MASRLEITIVSAENLPDVRRLGRMKVYATVSLNGDYNTMSSTSIDRAGNTNPTWNFPFVYTLPNAHLRRSGLDVVVDLYCERTLGDKLIGRVIIPVKSLFEMGLQSQRLLGYPIAGTRNGRLNVHYCFEESSLGQKGVGGVSWEGEFQLRHLGLLADFSSLTN